MKKNKGFFKISCYEQVWLLILKAEAPRRNTLAFVAVLALLHVEQGIPSHKPAICLFERRSVMHVRLACNRAVDFRVRNQCNMNKWVFTTGC